MACGFRVHTFYEKIEPLKLGTAGEKLTYSYNDRKNTFSRNEKTERDAYICLSAFIVSIRLLVIQAEEIGFEISDLQNIIVLKSNRSDEDFRDMVDRNRF
ncbi:hypothetical protein RF11_07625 [Thelohanellus kitauei]|uniref:Uncharacterized protein n=1 Tax=Thelohanellus kitauei TaxID=669202 RepID=A0A0C2N6G3_THEKT|nr:hypothetical protein RF11_07625 [Thelohanellus kitauei]